MRPDFGLCLWFIIILHDSSGLLSQRELVARQLQESGCPVTCSPSLCGKGPGQCQVPALLTPVLCPQTILFFTVSNWVYVPKVSKSRRHRQSKLDSSDSDSGSGQVQGKATKRKRTREPAEPAEPAGRKRSSRSKGTLVLKDLVLESRS